MTARIIDGNALSTALRTDLATRTATLKAQGIIPALAVILVGDDPASAVYVRNKIAACEKTGIRSLHFNFAADVAPAEVFAKIAALNADATVHGILVQLPLPKHIDADAVLDAITVEKDVDGFHAQNIGALTQGKPRFIPCTPYGVMKMLASIDAPLKGAEAVIVGRSNIVGKPMALLLFSPRLYSHHLSLANPRFSFSHTPRGYPDRRYRTAKNDHRRNDQTRCHCD